MTRKPGSGFTLIELLIVIVVIGILIGLLMPVINRTRDKAKVRLAEAQISALQSALTNYRFDNRVWPVSITVPDGEDAQFGPDLAPNRTVVQALTNTPSGTPPYLDAGDFNIKQGSVVDPWGVEYYIVFDSNQDGIVKYWNHNNKQKQRYASVLVTSRQRDLPLEEEDEDVND